MTEETTVRAFVYRPYRKAELARMYMPGCTQRVALRKFNRWLRFSPVLWDRLEAQRFSLTARDLTYDQVKTIVDYLGEP